MPSWQFDESTHQYRNQSTGRFLSPSGERGIAADYLAKRAQAVADLSAKVADGRVTAQQWETGMQKAIREAHGVQFALGRGGRAQVAADEWKALGGVVDTQNAYLRNFAEQLANGELTEAQIAARASMYVDAANSSYWQGKAATYDGLDLPALPGDGGTNCLSRCLCGWEIEEDDAEWRATWTLDGGEHCAGCVDRASEWNPYTQAKVAEGVAA